MTSLLVHQAPGVTTGRRPGLFRRIASRVVDWLLAPGICELDARTLADIGASQTLRAQAELREAWRRMDTQHRWTGL